MGRIEQRQNPRFDVDRDVIVHRSGQQYTGRMLNLSLGGARIVVLLQPAPTIGDELGLQFTVPGLEAPIEVRARVRWCADHDEATLGVQFVTGLRAKQTWAVGQYLDRLAAEAEG